MFRQPRRLINLGCKPRIGLAQPPLRLFSRITVETRGTPTILGLRTYPRISISGVFLHISIHD